MTGTRLPSDRQMQAWRLAGKLICQCAEPAPRAVAIFGGYECRVCARPIFGRAGEELVRLVLDELEDEA